MAILGLLSILFFCGLFVWFFTFVCRLTKSWFVRGVVLIVSLIIFFLVLSSMYLSYNIGGKEGLLGYFVTAGKKLLEAIQKNF